MSGLLNLLIASKKLINVNYSDVLTFFNAGSNTQNIISNSNLGDANKFMAINASEIFEKLQKEKPNETAEFFKNFSEPLFYPQDLFANKSRSKIESNNFSGSPYIFFIMRDSVIKSTNPLKRLALYMPPSVKVKYSANWEEVDLKLLQYNAGVQEIFSGKEVEDTFNSLARLGTDIGAKILDTAASTGEDFQQLNQFANRRTKDPQQALLFKTVDFRQFQFDFELLARTAEESESIRKIIKVFKWAMHPGKTEGNNYYLEYPNIFDIYLLTPASKYMFNVKQSVLVGMDVDYGGSGAAAFFKNTGAPVDVRLSLQFKELSVLTKNDIENDY